MFASDNLTSLPSLRWYPYQPRWSDAVLRKSLQHSSKARHILQALALSSRPFDTPTSKVFSQQTPSSLQPSPPYNPLLPTHPPTHPRPTPHPRPVPRQRLQLIIRIYLRAITLLRCPESPRSVPSVRTAVSVGSVVTFVFFLVERGEAVVFVGGDVFGG